MNTWQSHASLIAVALIAGMLAAGAFALLMTAHDVPDWWHDLLLTSVGGLLGIAQGTRAAGGGEMKP